MRVQVDLYHVGHERVAGELGERHRCRPVLLEEEGPAGGNPLYSFEGERDRLAALLLEVCAGDRERAEHLLSGGQG
jgi:hypothetical protein